MPIASTDIKHRLSGGAANANPAASLGGVMSSVEAVNYFDVVSSEEATAGSTEYRCIYVHNTHSTLTLYGARIWIHANTPSPSTDISIGLGTSGLNGTEAVAANELTAPAGVSFTSPSTFATGLVIGDIPPGQRMAIHVRRIVTAGAVSTTDTFTLRSQGDTNP